MVSSPESYTTAVKLLSMSTVIIHLCLLVLNLSFLTHLLHVITHRFQHSFYYYYYYYYYYYLKILISMSSDMFKFAPPVKQVDDITFYQHVPLQSVATLR